jgi:hypothetical protein
MTPVVGIDFDNTLVSYDALIHQIAVERGLIHAGSESGKRSVRDQIRLLPDGEIEWQKVQGLIYGPRMADAQLMSGAADFIRKCRAHAWPLYVVSHKTEFSGYDDTRTNLREAALAWMASQRFFDRDGLGFSKDQVFFEGTREAKIVRIKSLGCTHFIDDLEEVFLEPTFPEGVQKFLFQSWPALHGKIFASNT